jgi:hypothetical protein
LEKLLPLKAVCKYNCTISYQGRKRTKKTKALTIHWEFHTSLDLK